jgi:plastocyanin
MERRQASNVGTSEEGRVVTKILTRATLVAVTLSASLIGDRAPAATRPTVAIEHFTYAPSSLAVPVGTTVTWVNHDEEPHTVTSATGAFASSGLVNEDSFAQTFTRPGTYQYFCALHPHMRATVIVR